MPATIDATPDSETVVYVIGNDVQEVINSFDKAMTRLHSLDRQGDYVKVDKVFDILIDIRNSMKALIK